MEKELNYLSNKIYMLEGKINTLETNRNKYTTTTEINFYVSQLSDMKEEKEVLENILNKITEIVLT
jgi:prefoldin subunit 5